MEKVSSNLSTLSIDDLSSAIKSVRAGQVPALELGEDRPYNDLDFTGHLPKSFEALSKVLKLVADNELQIGNEKTFIISTLTQRISVYFSI